MFFLGFMISQIIQAINLNSVKFKISKIIHKIIVKNIFTTPKANNNDSEPSSNKKACSGK